MYSISLVILDNMMDDVVSDSNMMKVTTERNYHQSEIYVSRKLVIFHGSIQEGNQSDPMVEW